MRTTSPCNALQSTSARNTGSCRSGPSAVTNSAKAARSAGGVSSLATIGSTAPFVGLFGTVVGIINAFTTMSTEKSAGIAAIAGGISEALVTTALGLLVAVPAVWAFNYFTGRVDAFDVEMGNSSSELVDYFVKRAEAKSGARK